MKKNKKSVPTEKKFWIISIAVGICLVVLSVCFFSNVDKEKKEADLLDTVNYVKVQCSTYTHYNESSESKSLLRAIEGTRQVSKNIAAETENEKTLDDQFIDGSHLTSPPLSFYCLTLVSAPEISLPVLSYSDSG